MFFCFFGVVFLGFFGLGLLAGDGGVRVVFSSFLWSLPGCMQHFVLVWEPFGGAWVAVSVYAAVCGPEVASLNCYLDDATLRYLWHTPMC